MTFKVVQFTTHDLNGDTLYRETWPMQALGKTLPEFQVMDIHYQSPYRYQLAFDADLFVTGVNLDPDLVPILRWRRGRGKPTILDLQNHILDVDPWVPSFVIRNDPTRQSLFLHLMSLVDLVQTTTPFLADEFAPYCSRPIVFANQLPKDIVPARLPQKAESPLVVGWGGSASHLLDMADIAPAVSNWIAEREDVALWIMGDQEIADLFALPPEKKRHIPWGDMNAYLDFLRGVHIGLAPLHDTPFNRGRSDVKWLEYAAYGCVFLGQRMEVYSCSVEEGKTGFLFDDPRGLLRILDRLCEGRGLMESVRQAAFDCVSRNRRLSDHISERAEVYSELLEREPPPGAESWTLHEQSRFPRMNWPDPPPGYLPVKPQADEAKALDSLYFRRGDLSEDAIRWVEERYGGFYLACYARAQTAMVRGDLSAADGHLCRALSLYPASVDSMTLRGRVLLAMGQIEEARRMFSCAAQWHPAHIPAYVHLQTALEAGSNWDAAIAASEEWEKHCNYDPRARLMKGRILIRAGRVREGIETITDAMNRLHDGFSRWQRPLSVDLVHVLRELDGAMAGEEGWPDLIVQAARTFPYGTWLAVRAGAICFKRGDYRLGAQILEAARSRLLGWEWQSREDSGIPQQYRRIIETYRTACEVLANDSCQCEQGRNSRK